MEYWLGRSGERAFRAGLSLFSNLSFSRTTHLICCTKLILTEISFFWSFLEVKTSVCDRSIRILVRYCGKRPFDIHFSSISNSYFSKASYQPEFYRQGLHGGFLSIAGFLIWGDLVCVWSFSGPNSQKLSQRNCAYCQRVFSDLLSTKKNALAFSYLTWLLSAKKMQILANVLAEINWKLL